jgi:hypothetical protein
MRPEFIPSSVFRTWMPPSALNKHARVDGILAGSYVARCAKQGNPIRSAVVDEQVRYRLLDIVARARAQALRVEPCEDTIAGAQYALSSLTSEIASARIELLAIKREFQAESHRVEFSELARILTNKQMLTESDIVGQASAMRTYCGVYFLIAEGRVAYVGQSTNVINRIGWHADKKTFDSVAIIPCPKEHLDVVESLYIHMLRPPMNGRSNRGYLPEKILAPLTFEEIVAMASRVESIHG